MGLPIVFTPQSQEDLREIVKFIALDSPTRAENFGHKLISVASSVSTFPQMGRVVPELNDSSVREIVHGSYRIIYEVFLNPPVIYVLRFWHASRGHPDVNKLSSDGS